MRDADYCHCDIIGTAWWGERCAGASPVEVQNMTGGAVLTDEGIEGGAVYEAMLGKRRP